MRAYLVFLLCFVVAVSGCVDSPEDGSGDIPQEETSVEEEESDEDDLFSTTYRQGESKSDGNYVDSSFTLEAVRTDDDDFGDFEIVRATIAAEIIIDDSADISSYAFELRDSELPPLETRRDHPFEVIDEDGLGNTNRDDNHIWERDMSLSYLMNHRESKVVSPPTENFRIEDVSYGCYNATLELRELSGFPSQDKIGDPREYYLSSLHTEEFCLHEDEKEGDVIEVATEPQLNGLTYGDFPLDYDVAVLNQTDEYYDIVGIDEEEGELISNLVTIFESDEEAENSLEEVKEEADLTYIESSNGDLFLREHSANVVEAIIHKENKISSVYVEKENEVLVEDIQDYVSRATIYTGISFELDELEEALD